MGELGGFEVKTNFNRRFFTFRSKLILLVGPGAQEQCVLMNV